MKIYRVAETQRHLENFYKEVDERDLSNDSERCILEKKAEEINISVEEVNISLDGYERQALIRIVFSEKDIIALHERLMKGQQEKLADYKNLQSENDKLKKDIWSLWKARGSAGELLKTVKKMVNQKLKLIG